MLRLQAIQGQTGRLLREMLEERGVMGGNAQGVVSYGIFIPNPTLPTLNANAGRQDKFQELRILHQAGIQVPEYTRNPAHNWPEGKLGRQFHHVRGRGINRYDAQGQLVGRFRAEPEFYTRYIDKVEEYRVWAFRKNVKGLYQKVRRGHLEAGRRAPYVWNYENGYAFEYVANENRTARQREVCTLGAEAIAALELDFGAADLVVDRQGRIYVLEVNTAPGVEGPRAGLTGLADSIVRWAQRGFPRRNGAGEAPAPRQNPAEEAGREAARRATEAVERERRRQERIAQRQRLQDEIVMAERAHTAARTTLNGMQQRLNTLQEQVGEQMTRVGMEEQAILRTRAALEAFDREQ